MKPKKFSIGDVIRPDKLIALVSNADRWAILGLVAANFLPILLAVFCGWEIGDVVMFYWWENVILGLIAILRIGFAGAGGKEMQAVKLFCIPFFTMHYFGFCFGHATFLQVIFFDSNGMESPFEFYGNLLSGESSLLPVGGWLGISVLFLTHFVSFVRGYLIGGESKQCISFAEMFRPYGRIMVLHVGIIFGALAAMWLGSPMILVVLLMVFKTIFDLVAYAAGKALSEKSAKWNLDPSGIKLK